MGQESNNVITEFSLERQKENKMKPQQKAINAAPFPLVYLLHFNFIPIIYSRSSVFHHKRY